MKRNPPDSVAMSENLEDGEELLIVRVIVQLRRSERTRIESNWVNLTVGADIRQYTCDHVVRSVGFDNDRHVWLIVCEDWHGCECFFERVERASAVRGEIPQGIFSREACEWDHNVQVIIDKAMIEIGKAEEGLNVLHFLRLGPVANDIDFILSHRQASGRETIAQVLSGVHMEFTFLGFRV